MLPDDCVGVMALINNRPLEYRNVETNTAKYRIVERGDDYVRLSQIESSTHTKNNYLGGILSNDRTIVYWVNNTQPLP